MKISWDKKILFGVFSIICGLILLAFNITDTGIGLSVINMGAIITVASYAATRSKEPISHDERTRTISAQAASYSWMITFVSLAILVWILEYSLIELSAQAVVGIALFEMSVSMLISKWVITRKVS